MKITLFADGGSRGNPGPAAAGAVLLDEDGQVIAEVQRYLGTATNNEAEYAAVIFGLEQAVMLGCTEMAIRLDSKLIVEQLSGRWKIKDIKMRRAAEKAHVYLAQIGSWELAHVRREANTAADALVNAELDARGFRKSSY